MGGYRQWRLDKRLGFSDSNKSKKQQDRFKLILNQWEKAIMENKEVIVLMDTNIDTLLKSNHNASNRISPLLNDLQDHINHHEITIHNDKPTHFHT